MTFYFTCENVDCGMVNASKNKNCGSCGRAFKSGIDKIGGKRK